MWPQVKEGLRWVVGHRWLRAIAACTATSNFFNSMFFAVLLVYVVRVLHFSAAEIGVMFAVGSCGSIVGALAREPDPEAHRRRAGDRPRVDLFLLHRPHLRPRPAERRVADLHAGPGHRRVRRRRLQHHQVSLRQAITPERLQGRMNAAMRWIVWGTIPLGALLGGAIGQWIGLRHGDVDRRDRQPHRVPPGSAHLRALDSGDACVGGGAHTGAGRASKADSSAGNRCRLRPRPTSRSTVPHMPELPEMEAWRRQLDEPVSASPIAKAGPAHIATLKTFDPPPSALEGRRLRGAERRAKRLLFPTDDGELVLLVHLMTAGRLKYLAAGAKGPTKPAFALEFADGAKLVLTENAQEEARRRLAPHAGSRGGRARAPRPGGGHARRGAARRDPPSDSRRLHAFLRDQRLIAGIGRAWANEILHTAKLSPYALSRDLDAEETERLAAAIHDELERGLALRESGRVRREDVPRPPPPRRAVPRLRHTARAGRLRGAHDLLLPDVPDRRTHPQGPANVAAAAVIASDGVVELRAPTPARLRADRSRSATRSLPVVRPGRRESAPGRVRLGRRTSSSAGSTTTATTTTTGSSPARSTSATASSRPHAARATHRARSSSSSVTSRATPSTTSRRCSSTPRTRRRSRSRAGSASSERGEVNGEPFFRRALR